MCCPLEQLPPPTEKAREYVNIVTYLMYGELLIALLRIIVGDFSGMFNDLISALILYQGYKMLSYCSLIFFVFFNVMSIATTVNFIGGQLQKGATLFPAPVQLPIILYIAFAYYLVASYYAFYAYREFKAIAMDGSLPQMQGGGLGAGLFGGGGTGNSDGVAERADYRDRDEDNGSTYQPPQQNQGVDMAGGRSQNNNNNNGAFQAFTGKGVSLA